MREQSDPISGQNDVVAETAWPKSALGRGGQEFFFS